MSLEIKEVLEKLILPVQDGWKLDKIEIDEVKNEVNVYLYYNLKDYKGYPLYDGRSERKWRHLDLWQYKTYIYCKLPRYVGEDGKAKTVEVPWADSFERMTWLLEKKR